MSICTKTGDKGTTSPANAEREVHVFFSETEIYIPNHDIDFSVYNGD